MEQGRGGLAALATPAMEQGRGGLAALAMPAIRWHGARREVGRDAGPLSVAGSGLAGKEGRLQGLPRPCSARRRAGKGGEVAGARARLARLAPHAGPPTLPGGHGGEEGRAVEPELRRSAAAPRAEE